MDSKIISTIMAIALTIFSGFCDAQGFIYATKIWNMGQISWSDVWKSGLGYGSGILLYWVSLRFFNLVGINSAEIQTLGWFIVTIVGVALFSGEFLKWGVTNQILGVIAIVSIAVLMFRNGG